MYIIMLMIMHHPLAAEQMSEIYCACESCRWADAAAG